MTDQAIPEFVHDPELYTPIDPLASISGLPSKSAQIRKLAKDGHSRARIAQLLGIRYQFVRNVLIAQK